MTVPSKLKARWAAIPGVEFPAEAQSSVRPKPKRKRSTQRNYKPHSLYLQDPNRYTVRGKVRKCCSGPAPDPAVWCSSKEAAAILGLSPARTSQLARREKIETREYFVIRGHAWGSARTVHFRREQVVALAEARAAAKANKQPALRPHSRCASCVKRVKGGHEFFCEHFQRNLHSGRLSCTGYIRKEDMK